MAAALHQSLVAHESGSLALDWPLQRDECDMRKCVAGLCGLALLAMCTGNATAQGDETGVASIHEWVRVGRKKCLLDHFHDGNGAGATRREAERAAILAWTEFTAWEYGGIWGRYAIAASKRMDCSQGSGGWTCNVQARACRPF
jgi:hypothetical protein